MEIVVQSPAHTNTQEHLLWWINRWHNENKIYKTFNIRQLVRRRKEDTLNIFIVAILFICWWQLNLRIKYECQKNEAGRRRMKIDYQYYAVELLPVRDERTKSLSCPLKMARSSHSLSLNLTLSRTHTLFWHFNYTAAHSLVENGFSAWCVLEIVSSHESCAICVHCSVSTKCKLNFTGTSRAELNRIVVRIVRRNIPIQTKILHCK